MSDDLVERLKASTSYDVRSDAADLIETQDARIAELEAALEKIVRKTPPKDREPWVWVVKP